MKLLADESIDRMIVDRLRADGHDVTYVAEVDAGITDPEVLQRANEISALLVTSDKDFGELVFQQGFESSFGVVLVRVSGVFAEHKAEIVSAAFRQHEHEFQNNFSVITAGRVRIQAKS